MSEKRFEEIFGEKSEFIPGSETEETVEVTEKNEASAEETSVEEVVKEVEKEASIEEVVKETAEKKVSEGEDKKKTTAKKAKKPEIKVNISKDQVMKILIPALIITVVAAVISLVLSGVFELTNGFEERYAEKKLEAAMQSVLPADSYDPVEFEFEESNHIESVHKAMTADGDIGYCVETTEDGINGGIHLVVGVDKEGKITKVEILAMSESVGVGAKTKEPAFLEQFISKSGNLKIVNIKAKDDTEIVAVSGATVSSEAVCTGVNHAVAAVSQLKAKEAQAEADAAAQAAEAQNAADAQTETKEAQAE